MKSYVTQAKQRTMLTSVNHSSVQSSMESYVAQAKQGMIATSVNKHAVAPTHIGEQSPTTLNTRVSLTGSRKHIRAMRIRDEHIRRDNAPLPLTAFGRCAIPSNHVITDPNTHATNQDLVGGMARGNMRYWKCGECGWEAKHVPQNTDPGYVSNAKSQHLRLVHPDIDRTKYSAMRSVRVRKLAETDTATWNCKYCDMGLTENVAYEVTKRSVRLQGVDVHPDKPPRGFKFYKAWQGEPEYARNPKEFYEQNWEGTKDDPKKQNQFATD